MSLFVFQPKLKQSTMNPNNDEDYSDAGGDDGGGSNSDHSFCNENLCGRSEEDDSSDKDYVSIVGKSNNSVGLKKTTKRT